MAVITNAPRGTQDVLPSQSYKWKHIENVARKISSLYGFKEIRFPTFEHTELFQRSVGDTTDVVQKEMYTFNDKGDRSITLRPEGTAGTVRAVIENGLLNEALPLKVSYLVSCFRYEKPQAGRLREFHQFGAEMFGSASPSADAQLIAMVKDIFDFLGISNISLEINSIGCPECRKNYHEALMKYFEGHTDRLCETCKGRLEKNPMRILDCKSPICSEIAKDAPKIIDFLCDECSEHFDGVKKRLDMLEIDYTVNPSIVRGLDYYTKTVFEFVSSNIGAQGTVCGGGRYDGLVSQMGGQDTPALGFAMGLERLILLMDACGCEYEKESTCDVYIASIGDAAAMKAFELSASLRKEGFFAESDVMGRSVKAQMKYADKIGAKYSMVLGDSEIETGKAVLKNMADGSSCEIALDEIAQKLYDSQIDSTMGSIIDLLGGEFPNLSL